MVETRSSPRWIDELIGLQRQRLLACKRNLDEAQLHVDPSLSRQHERPKPDEVGGTCSTGIECVKVRLLWTAKIIAGTGPF
jgi:hypothetical protein